MLANSSFQRTKITLTEAARLTARIVIVPTLVVGTMSVGATVNQASATTASERAHCRGYENKAYERSPYKNGAAHTGSTLVIYYKNPGEDTRFCAVYDNNTDGKRKMLVKIGTRAQGDVSNPVTWSKKRAYYDRGRYSTYAGGVALTPGNNRCAVVVGTFRHDGHTDKIKLTQNLCN